MSKQLSGIGQRNLMVTLSPNIRSDVFPSKNVPYQNSILEWIESTAALRFVQDKLALLAN